jgi:hypothetical protein
MTSFLNNCQFVYNVFGDVLEGDDDLQKVG